MSADMTPESLAELRDQIAATIHRRICEHSREDCIENLGNFGPLVPVLDAAAVGDPDEDERIAAWAAIAAHPIFAPCYDTAAPLLPSMLDRLDGLHSCPHWPPPGTSSNPPRRSPTVRSYLPTPIAIGLVGAFTALLVVIGACLFTLGGVR